MAKMQAKIGSIVEVGELHPNSSWQDSDMEGTCLELTAEPMEFDMDGYKTVNLVGRFTTSDIMTCVNVLTYKVLFK